MPKIFLQIAYRIIYIYWFVFRPHSHGVQLILRRGNEVLFVQHTYMNKGLWDFPGGGTKVGETPLQALMRETEEELKIELRQIKEVGVTELYHSYHHDHVTIFEGILDDQILSFNSAEIKEVKWFPINDAPQNMSELSRKVLKQIRL